MSIQLIQQAVCYMEEHICENISYTEVAKSVHMSSYNFHRMFPFIAGMTAKEYIRKRRLTLAAQELQTTDISVIDAAYKYGYESPESFSKAFSRFHGTTPRQAKRKGTKIRLFNPLVIKIILEGGKLNGANLTPPWTAYFGELLCFSSLSCVSKTASSSLVFRQNPPSTVGDF